MMDGCIAWVTVVTTKNWGSKKYRANYKYCITNLNQEHAHYKGGVKVKLNILCARVEEIWWSVNAGEGMCIVYRATSW